MIFLQKESVKRMVYANITGLEGNVSRNHGFVGTGTDGHLSVQTFLCKCKPCAQATTTAGVNCEGKAYVDAPFAAELSWKGLGAVPGTADRCNERLNLRAERLLRHVRQGITSGDIVIPIAHGEKLKSDEHQDGALLKFCLAKPIEVRDTTAKRIKIQYYEETMETANVGGRILERVIYSQPTTQAVWERHVMMRPPFVVASKKIVKHKTQNGKFYLKPDAKQNILATIAADESYFTATSASHGL